MRIPKHSLRLFQNPVLERLTHIHPITPFLFWLPWVAFLLYRASAVGELSVRSILGVGLLGFCIWTLMEYLLHRFVFHFQSEHPAIKRFVFLLHGNHHDVPDDKTRLVMPLIASVPMAIALYLFFLIFLGSQWVDAFFAFFLLGYLWYDFTHYATHHFKPRTRLGFRVKKNHMDHHFVHHDSYWGVSSPFWDYIFGTLPERGKPPSTNQVHPNA